MTAACRAPTRKVAEVAGRGSARRGEGALAVSERELSLYEEGLARVGELDRPACAVDELDFELVFELTNLLAERRLRHVKTFSSSPEVALFRHRYEVAQ